MSVNENENINKFVNELVNICKKYNLSLAHEDSEGSFIIETYSEENIKWMCSAIVKE